MIRYFNIKDYFNKVKRYYNNIPPSKPLFINTENREDYLEIKNRLELMANINGSEGRIQGINHKYCQIIQRFDGYKYILERREMKSSHSSHS